MNWAIGVTAVPSRRRDLLPQTLGGLRHAGFDQEVRLFVDGCDHAEAASFEREFRLPVSARNPKLRVAMAWHLAFLELWLRNPEADRFCIVQDDVIFARNLRQYLEAVPWIPRSYLVPYWYPYKGGPLRGARRKVEQGWNETMQCGLGALMLIFDREAAIALLSAEHLIRRPLDAVMGWRKVDGGIVESMKKATVWDGDNARRQPIKEYAHYPSLVKHTGHTSTMNKSNTLTASQADRQANYVWPDDKRACSFPGIEFDCLSLLTTTGAAAPASRPRTMSASGKTARADRMSERLKAILAFFRPLSECKVASNDKDDVTVEWVQDDAPRLRWYDTPQGVKLEVQAAGVKEAEAEKAHAAG